MLQLIRSPVSRMGILILFACLVLSAIAVPSLAVTLTPGAQSGTATIANGDPVYIQGVATGQPPNGLQVNQVFDCSPRVLGNLTRKASPQSH